MDTKKYKVANLDLPSLGTQRNRDGRKRDAGPHVAARGVRQIATAQGRAHRRLPAHDDRDRGPHRDAHRARRRSHLDELQHLLDAGPSRRRDRGDRRARLRLEGRDRSRVRLVHRAAAHRVQGRQGPEPDPRRRRRSHRHRAQEAPRALRQGRHRRPLRGDHHRRASPLRHAQEGRAQGPRHQRQRLGHQVEVRQPLRLPRVARRRHQARHGRHDRRQGRGRVRLRRRRQGLRAGAHAASARASSSPRSIPSARCKRRWKATRSRRWRSSLPRATSSSPPPAARTSSPAST